ncbi:hypothetical protein ASF61_21650 [Duganella sp. Leaf126]|uniref:SIR2 family NAD-dependent protein deacylase n=1 Tax=Duganella sp. Leaf126 TaxID=1736266 RepID=UPI0006F81288|nr:SIR2 family protein [Duganella sp. Leaf126]KQQ44486.1 hypothetical protein ASF61_21650 [Duganella sp. Leaf126]
MNEMFEIAYAAASGRLCLFTGTGFSKAVTDNAAPSWQMLLESACDHAAQPDALKAALFPKQGNNPLTLEESAQVIAIELSKQGKDIHEEIAKNISALSPKGENSAIVEFLSKRSFDVITTNYDKLVEELAGKKDCHSITPGLPIPRSPARVQVYHVHGSIDSPQNMVVTSDDYFRFINSQSYFSRKLSTVLHENTVVILGYSLGDTNLKAIISDYNGFSKNHVIGSSIFLVSRSKVDQHIKDYYSHCYGIRVLDQLEAHQFFSNLNAAMPAAEKCTVESIQNIRKVIFDKQTFTDKYLGIENSFFEIISALGAIGLSINNAAVVDMLGVVIKAKIRLTQEPSAWVQYEHLAKWLIYLGTILKLKGTSIETVYLEATLKSMKSMGASTWGHSWKAYGAWKNDWSKIIASNRDIIRQYIEGNTDWPDALNVVRSS